MTSFYHHPVIGTGNATITGVIGRTLDWHLRTGRTARPDKQAASESVTVRGGTWVYTPEQLPYASGKPHPYFTAPEGQSLAESLRNSGGRDARLLSFDMDSGWLVTTWGGLIVKSGEERIDHEISSGNGQRLFFQFPALRLNDAVVALQRNSSNYFHFLTEVMPSLIAWQKNLRDDDTIALTATPFAIKLLRLAGFGQKVSLLQQPASIRANNVRLLRLLPVGYFNLELLLELSTRVMHGVKPERPGNEVVFLTRARSDRRNLTNENDVLEIVRQRFPSVEVVVPGSLPVEEQVRKCHSAPLSLLHTGLMPQTFCGRIGWSTLSRSAPGKIDPPSPWPACWEPRHTTASANR